MANLGAPMTIQDMVKVDGLTCVGVPIGTPDFKLSSLFSWAKEKLRDQIKDLQQLRLMSDPLIHCHLVRFCGLARPGYMCRTLPPELLLAAGLADFDLAVSTGVQWRDWPDATLAWHRTTLQLPHHLGGLGLTPACASGIAAFNTATARSAR